MIKYQLERISDFIYKVSSEARGDMLVPGFIYADEELAREAIDDQVLAQVANVATLKGIVRGSFAMPDIHLGYGFAVGGVAAFDEKEGIVSPGGVGFDINCGVRLLRTNLIAKEIADKINDLMHELARNVAYGVGGKGRIRLSRLHLERVAYEGVPWAVKNGYGWPEDIEFCEQKGSLQGADPGKVSKRAFERGANQLGTLGAGNHFLEVQEVTDVFDHQTADVFGLFEGQLTVMIHSGSRGFGHQICTDYLKSMAPVAAKYGIHLPDRQLACAPADSPESKDYMAAMAAGMNYAWTNRHMIAHLVRGSFEYIFKKNAESLQMQLVYDVAHNSAKRETHLVEGEEKKVIVHRKGATRAFGPDHPDVVEQYRQSGQPVIIPGDMGRASYILSGTAEAMRQTFGSTCHGAGRLMSRSQAKKNIEGARLKEELQKKGIVIVTGHVPSLAEEAPQAYKDVNKVVEVCQGAGISNKIAKVRPLGVLKG